MIVFLLPLLGQGSALSIWRTGEESWEVRRWGDPAGMGGMPPGGSGAVPVSSRFCVRSAGQELLVTPTREAVTWGSPLYTFK